MSDEPVTTGYAASHGSYSGYRVDCLFTSRELADEYVERMQRMEPDEEWQVEEFDLYDGAPELVIDEKTVFSFVGRKVDVDRTAAQVLHNRQRLAAIDEKLHAAKVKVGLA